MYALQIRTWNSRNYSILLTFLFFKLQEISNLVENLLKRWTKRLWYSGTFLSIGNGTCNCSPNWKFEHASIRNIHSRELIWCNVTTLWKNQVQFYKQHWHAFVLIFEVLNKNNFFRDVSVAQPTCVCSKNQSYKQILNSSS